MIFIRVLHLPLEAVNNSRKCYRIEISNVLMRGRALPDVAFNALSDERAKETMCIRRIPDIFVEAIAGSRDVCIKMISVIVDVDSATIRT